jgi:hypothetical protein
MALLHRIEAQTDFMSVLSSFDCWRSSNFDSELDFDSFGSSLRSTATTAVQGWNGILKILLCYLLSFPSTLSLTTIISSIQYRRHVHSHRDSFTRHSTKMTLKFDFVFLIFYDDKNAGRKSGGMRLHLFVI